MAAIETTALAWMLYLASYRASILLDALVWMPRMCSQTARSTLYSP